MPWCEPCAKYWTPNSMNDDGTCPECGEVVEEPPTDEVKDKAPWHFKLLVGTLGVYLVYRTIWLISKI